jgi:uncharacterized protein (DUF305 family)
VREFAQKVVDDQTRDLQQFDAWLAQHQPESSFEDTAPRAPSGDGRHRPGHCRRASWA